MMTAAGGANVTADSDQPYVDAQSLSDVDMHVYETIATLEYLGRPATRSEIAAAAELDEPALGETLRALTERRLLVRSDASGEPAFEPAQRGWSTTPDQPRGPQRL
jgi:hypothetical protein